MSTPLVEMPAVAVIGMAGRFPGARDVHQFWDNLRGGAESISVFSEQEMVDAGVDRAAVRAPDYVPSRGLAPDLDLFDAAFFGYTPREAELMDPQHRAFLECAWEALEDAGIDSERYEGGIGVYAGTSISTYLINNVVPRMGGLGAGAIQAALANDKDHVPTRVSYKMNLRGPSVNVQTACSTSLVATHMACQSLLSGECDVALAGGVSVTVPLRAGYQYEEGSILSPDGHCRAFDAASNGTVGGSGVAIVVLKLLEHAIADCDTIHAVIRGSAINNDGSFKVGYTAPSVEGQAEVIAQAHGIAEVAPETITYVETHGTATPLGDPIEVAALTRAFREQTDRVGFCAIGSVKTNIGHMDAAAGVTGLIKTVLALKHAEIPPSLHFESPNPELGIESTPFYVNATLAAWETGGLPRRAGVSSFGIGGTNAHVILEQAPNIVESSASRPHQLLTLSARTDAALQESATRLADHLERFPDAPLADAAYTLHVGRRGFARRGSVVARDREGAVTALRALSRPAASSASAVPDRPALFMFPGQGSQHIGMGRLLYESEATFKKHVDECFELLTPMLQTDPRAIIWPEDTDSEEARARLTDTRFAQPIIFALQYSLAQLWLEWGVRPQGMIGHSIGEYAAACVGGVFDVADALRLVTARGRLMAEQPPGSMLAVPLPRDEVGDYLQDGVSLAAVNQIGLSVLSGPTDAIDALAEVLHERGVEGRKLHTSHAFHSSMMDPALAPFEAEVASIDLQAPTIPFVSCVTGRTIRDEEAIDPAYWARHLREPVLFAEGLGALLEGFPDAVLVEVGSSQTLSALSRRHPSGPTVVPTLPHARSDDDDALSAIRALGGVWEAGASVDWSGFHGRETRRKVSLPTYPFQRHRYWIEAGEGGWSSADRLEDDGKLPNVDDWFYVPTWRQTVVDPGPVAEAPHRWLVLGDDVTAAAGVMDFVRGLGCEIVSVGAGTEFREVSTGHFVVDPVDPDHYVSLLDELDASDRTPHVILHAWAAGPRPEAPSGAGTDAGIAEELDRGVHSLISLAQALAQSGRVEPLRVAALTIGAIDVSGDSPLLPARAAALAALKVVAQEVPGVTAVGLDIDDTAGGSGREPDLARVVADLCAPSPPAAVAYRGRRRFVEGHERVRRGPDGDPSLLRERGVYLVIGGLGGVGLEVARHLHRVCGARLALTTTRTICRDDDGGWREEGASRDEALAEVAALQAAGAEVLLIRSDVTDPDQIEAAFAEAEKVFGVVHGAVFAAGVTKSPTPLSGTDRGEIEVQLDTRIRGLQGLSTAADRRALDFCLVQSSLASVLGAAGFVGYTAAHGFMDAYAAEQDRVARVPWVAVDWDNWITWKDAGSGIERTAEFYMSPAEGGRALESALCLARSHQRLVVSTGALDVRIKRWINPSGDSDAESSADSSGGSRYARPDTGAPFEAPTNDDERALAEIWGEILGIEPVGIRDDFFELGGDSVLGIQVVAKARRAGLRLSAQEIFQYPTIAQMAEVAGRSVGVDAEQGPVTGPVPLTPIQRWFFAQDFPETHHFNMPVLLEAEDVDVTRLGDAVARLMAHHDALRMRFEWSDAAGWSQHVGNVGAEVDVAVIDLSQTPPERLAAELAEAASAFQSSLRLAAGPLFRPVVVRTAPEIPDRVLLIAHHLVVDAVSWRVLLEDLNTIYRQLEQGEAVELPAKTTSYKRWAEVLQDYSGSAVVAGEEPQWSTAAGRPVPPLPRDLDTDPNTFGTLTTVAASLDEEHTRALLQEVPKALAAKIDEILLASLASTLTGWTAEQTVRIALEGHGREELGSPLDLSRTVGWFTSLFPVLLDVDRTGSPEAALRAVKEQYRPIVKGGIGYGVLRYSANAGQGGVLEASPDPEVSFLYLGRYREDASGAQPFRALRESGGSACDSSLERPHLFDVLASVVAGRLEVEVGFSSNCHTAATAQQLATGFVDTLAALVERAAEPGERVVVASDFPDSGLTQEQLDDLISGMKE